MATRTSGNYPSLNWSEIQLKLDKIYAGKPLSASGFVPRLPDPVVSVWRILSGRARVQYRELSAQALPGEFLVCLPGAKRQQFEDETELMSVHFLLKDVSRESRWQGPHLIELGNDASLSVAGDRLFQTARRWKICGDRYRGDQRFSLPLPGLMEVQSELFGFCGRLVTLLSNVGIRFDSMLKDSRVEGGVEWLRAQPLNHKFNRSEFARHFHLSPSQVDRLWRQELRWTPRQYWESIRLEKTCALLHDSSVSVKEIAYQLGFAHLSQFSSWFHAQKGESPRRFRYRQERMC